MDFSKLGTNLPSGELIVLVVSEACQHLRVSCSPQPKARTSPSPETWWLLVLKGLKGFHVRLGFISGLESAHSRMDVGVVYKWDSNLR